MRNRHGDFDGITSIIDFSAPSVPILINLGSKLIVSDLKNTLVPSISLDIDTGGLVAHKGNPGFFCQKNLVSEDLGSPCFKGGQEFLLPIPRPFSWKWKFSMHILYTSWRNRIAFSVTQATISMFFDANEHFSWTLSVIFGLLMKFYFGHSVVSIVFTDLLAKSHFARWWGIR